jgi:hypothetical protein
MKLSKIEERVPHAASSLLECLRRVERPSSEDLREMLISLVLFWEDNPEQVHNASTFGSALYKAYECALCSEHEEDWEVDLLESIDAEAQLREVFISAYKNEVGRDANADEAFSWPECLEYDNLHYYEKGFLRELGYAMGFREAMKFKKFSDWHRKNYPEETKRGEDNEP